MYLQKEANNKILLDKLNKNKHFIEVINPIIEFSRFKTHIGESSYPALALAGGSLTSVWNDTPVNDWDLYIMDISLCNTAASKKFFIIHLLSFIASKYPLSNLKVHSSNSKSEDKMDTYSINKFIKALEFKFDNCGLISLEIITNEHEVVNAQLIFLNLKSFSHIFPEEKPVQYFSTHYDVDTGLFTGETFLLKNFTFTASNSRINSNDAPFINSSDTDKINSLSLDFYLYFSYFLDWKLQPLATSYYKRPTLKRFLLCPSNLIQTYDFTCVSAYYFNGEVDCVDSFYSDNESKTLVINPYHSNILNFHLRVKKYSDRGYFIDSNVLMETLHKQYELLSGDSESYPKYSVIPISYYRKVKFAQEVKSIIDNPDSFEVNRKMECFTL